MRPSLPPEYEQFRIDCEGEVPSPRGAVWGAFLLGKLRALSSGAEHDNPYAEGWEHVSVSVAGRCPSWTEMCYVKNIFWLPEECVLQFHPPEKGYINCHPHTLHLWRNPKIIVPLPPSILIGTKPGYHETIAKALGKF